MNGLEAVAEAHNDGTLFIDELAQVDAYDATTTAYLLANGQGKARMTRTMGGRRNLTWTLLFVSAGELTLAEHAASVGRRAKAGAEVRLLNVPADAGQGFGMFENLHGASSSQEFVGQLRDAALNHYGAPIRAFLQQLVNKREIAESIIRSAKESLAGSVPPGANGQVLRAADRFALIAAAGELATAWRLTGWREGEAIAAAERGFGDWLGMRGTIGNSDVEAGVRQVRSFLYAHGTSRFQLLCGSSKGNVEDGEHSTRDRAGFRRLNRQTGETEYLIFPEAFRAEVCAGHDYQAVAKELEHRGFLLREPPSMMIKPRLPEGGTTWMYGIRAAVLEGDEC
jgi:putative DNA primase/helicase